MLSSWWFWFAVINEFAKTCKYRRDGANDICPPVILPLLGVMIYNTLLLNVNEACVNQYLIINF